MTTLRKALLLTLLAAFVGLPLAAQGTDCSFTRTFTGNLTATSSSNLSAFTPCVNWRVTLSTTGTLSSTVTFQTSPDNITFTAVPNTPCTGAGTNCVYQGANPIVGTQGMVSVSAYGSYIRVVTTSSSGTGTGTIRGYGAKGITASYITPGTTGTVTGVTFTGGIISVANPTTAPAFTVAGTSGGIPYFSSASTWASSALLTATYAVLGGGAGNPPVSSTTLNDAAGKIGIGTVSTAYSLDVSKGVGLTGTARFFDQTATTGSTLVTITPGAAQTSASTLLSVGGAVIVDQIMANNIAAYGTVDQTAIIASGGYGGGFALNDTAFAGIVDYGSGTHMVFYAGASAGTTIPTVVSSTDRLELYSGNFGIGMTPVNKLDVNGSVGANAFKSTGTTYTLSTNTCSGTSLVGGATAGTFVSGTTGTCTVVVTMGSSATAPTGWHCTANDRTTVADVISQTASTTTTASLSGPTLTNDIIAFSCIGY